MPRGIAGIRKTNWIAADRYPQHLPTQGSRGETHDYGATRTPENRYQMVSAQRPVDCLHDLYLPVFSAYCSRVILPEKRMGKCPSSRVMGSRSDLEDCCHGTSHKASQDHGTQSTLGSAPRCLKAAAVLACMSSTSKSNMYSEIINDSLNTTVRYSRRSIPARNATAGPSSAWRLTQC